MISLKLASSMFLVLVCGTSAKNCTLEELLPVETLTNALRADFDSKCAADWARGLTLPSGPRTLSADCAEVITGMQDLLSKFPNCSINGQNLKDQAKDLNRQFDALKDFLPPTASSAPMPITTPMANTAPSVGNETTVSRATSVTLSSCMAFTVIVFVLTSLA
jgi:hypothetical protein